MTKASKRRSVVFSRTSSSPIVAAFARSSLRKAEANDSPANDDDIVEKTYEQHDSDPTKASQGKRHSQVVNTIRDRDAVKKWMRLEINAGRGIKVPSRAVKQFPTIFRSLPNANIRKAMRWMSDAMVPIVQPEAFPKSISSKQRTGRLVALKKAVAGRGRKEAPWVTWLHKRLIFEFDRLRKVIF